MKSLNNYVLEEFFCRKLNSFHVYNSVNLLSDLCRYVTQDEVGATQII